MPAMFDISVLGDKAVSRALDLLPEKSQFNVLRTATRRSNDRLRNDILLNLSGRDVEERTGRYVRAIESQKIRVVVEKKFAVISTLNLPSRASLGISPGDKWYYPAILEYGSPTMTAKSPIRRAVNQNQDREQGKLVRDISKGIKNQWKRLNK